MPKYSVIIPSYNRKLFLEKAVKSVLKQSVRDFELILVDDGSEDSTVDMIRGFTDKRIRYYYIDNRGSAGARNYGIARSSGELLAFLDSDDWWLKNKLEETEKAVSENPLYKIFHTQEKWFRGGKVWKPI